MQANLRPFLYNFSPSVVPPPLDWPDWIRVTGYWFLDEADGYEPPADLVAFIEKARQDNKKLVYVGFGSIVIEDPAALNRWTQRCTTEAQGQRAPVCEQAFPLLSNHSLETNSFLHSGLRILGLEYGSRKSTRVYSVEHCGRQRIVNE